MPQSLSPWAKKLTIFGFLLLVVYVYFSVRASGPETMFAWQQSCDARCSTTLGATVMGHIDSWDCPNLRSSLDGKQNPDPAYLAGLKDPELEKRLNVEWVKALQDRMASLNCQ